MPSQSSLCSNHDDMSFDRCLVQDLPGGSEPDPVRFEIKSGQGRRWSDSYKKTSQNRQALFCLLTDGGLISVGFRPTSICRPRIFDDY